MAEEKKKGASLKIVRLNESAIIPTRAYPGDAGLDLYANEEVVLAVGEIRAVGTGITIELPELTEAQIRPRSGLALKGITVHNAPGTIDSGFRGEVKVILYNASREWFVIDKGDKIAQMVIAPYLVPDIVEVPALDRLSETERGEKGFGSSGI